MKKYLILAISTLFVFISSVANATDYTGLGKTMHYVRAGASGNADGSDWTNAWTALPSTLTRDHVYFIADGSYSGITLDDAVSGTDYIYIVKATTDDHGTDTGWSSAYGDGVADFEKSTGSNTVYVSTSYWVIDGQDRTDWDEGHGFRFYNSTSTSTAIVKVITMASGISNVTLLYSEVENRGIGLTAADGSNVGDDFVYATWSSNMYYGYCYFHNATRNGVFMIGSNNTMDHCLLEELKQGGTLHGQAIYLFGYSSDITISYTIIKNTSNAAMINCAWGTDGLDVFGCVFDLRNTSYSNGDGVLADISDEGEIGLSNLNFFNNTTIADSAAPDSQGVRIDLSPDPTSNRAYNNLWIDCPSVRLDPVHDYNHLVNSTWAYGSSASSNDSVYSESGTLNDPDNWDYTLVDGKTAIDAGYALGSPFSSISGYNVDGNGVTRGTDGYWDIGAFEGGEPGAGAGNLIITSADDGTESNPTIFDGGEYGYATITGAEWIIIRNATFTYENESSATDFGVMEIDSSSNITIENCVIDGRDTGGEADAACHCIDITSSSDVTIQDCTLTQYADDAIEVSGTSSNLVVRDCDLTEGYSCGTDGSCGPCDNGHGDALEIWGLSGLELDGSWIWIEDGTSGLITGTGNSDFLITNNVFYTPGCGFSAYFYNSINGVELYNNVFWGGTYGGLALDDTPTDLYAYNNITQSVNYNHLSGTQQADHYIDYNLIGTTGQGYTSNTNDIEDSDPEFTVAPAVGGSRLTSPLVTDFDLSETSPAIDEGTSGGNIPTVDIQDNDRGATYDMGAFEYGTPVDAEDPTTTISTQAYGDGIYVTTPSTVLNGSSEDDVEVTGNAWANNQGGGDDCEGTEEWSAAVTGLTPTTFGTNLDPYGAFDSAYTGWSATATASLQITTYDGYSCLEVSDNGGDWTEAQQTFTVEDGEQYFIYCTIHAANITSGWNGRIFYEFAATRSEDEGDGYLYPAETDQWVFAYAIVTASGTNLSIGLFSNGENDAYFRNFGIKKVTTVNEITVTVTDSSAKTGTDAIDIVYEEQEESETTTKIVPKVEGVEIIIDGETFSHTTSGGS